MTFKFKLQNIILFFLLLLVISLINPGKKLATSHQCWDPPTRNITCSCDYGEQTGSYGPATCTNPDKNNCTYTQGSRPGCKPAPTNTPVPPPPTNPPPPPPTNPPSSPPGDPTATKKPTKTPTGPTKKPTKTPTKAPTSTIKPTRVPGGNLYSSGDLTLPILDNLSLTSFMTVPDYGNISSIKVRLRLNHTYDGDLKIRIEAPDGNFVWLSKLRGGAGDNFGSNAQSCNGTLTQFTDGAQTPIANGSPPFNGNYIPEASLNTTLGNKQINGVWKLQIIDTFTSGTANNYGTLYCWQLDITHDGPTPTVTVTPNTSPTSTPTRIPTVTIVASPTYANGPGLNSKYFNAIVSTFPAEPSPAKIMNGDEISHNWGTAAPVAGVNADQFTVLWKGLIQPRFSGNYVFSTTVNDGVKLWVDNENKVSVLLIDNWQDRLDDKAIRDDSNIISLTAGTKYKLRMEYYDKTGNARAELRWLHDNEPYNIVPKSQLFPPEAVSVTPTQPAATNTPTAGPGTPTLTPLPSGTPTITPTATPAAFEGNGTGLTGRYFNNKNHTGNGLTRIDETVKFIWGTGSPDPIISPADSFSVRWEGYVQPQFTGFYTFYARANDAVRLWYWPQGQSGNGVLIIDQWTQQNDGQDIAATWANSPPLSLVAGQKYRFKMDYAEESGNAEAKLSWSGASGRQLKDIIPKSQLYPEGQGGGTPTLTPTPTVTCTGASCGTPTSTPTITPMRSPTITPTTTPSVCTVHFEPPSAWIIPGQSEVLTAVVFNPFTQPVDFITFTSGDTSKVTVTSPDNTSPYTTLVTALPNSAPPNAIINISANVTINGQGSRCLALTNITVSANVSPTPSRTPSPTLTPSVTPSSAVSLTPTQTPRPTRTPQPTPPECPDGNSGSMDCDDDGTGRGLINESDLQIMLVNWRTSVSQPEPEWQPNQRRSADLTGDGLVDESDLQILLTNWRPRG